MSKLTKRELQRLIREEVRAAVLNEAVDANDLADQLGNIQGELLNLARGAGEFERQGGKIYLAKLANQMQPLLAALRTL